nr:hypothetical protein [Tanacetum cinerariifolium]
MFTHQVYFLCINGFAVLIRTADPTKARIGERQRDEDEPKLLETTVGRVVPLLPVAPDRSSGELEASVNKLFDEGEVVSRRSRVIPAVQKAEVRGGVMPTLPFVLYSVSTTSEREGRDHTELLAWANLRTIRSPQRFIISSDSSDYSGVNIAEAEVDYVVRISMPIITSATTTTPTADLLLLLKRNSLDLLYLVLIPLPRAEVILFLVASLIVLYNIRERRRLNSIVEEKDALLKSKDEEIESLKAQFVLKEAEAAEAIRLRAEASNFQAVEQSIQSEMAALKERNNLPETEKSGLDVIVADLAASVKVRDQEVADLDVVVTLLSYKMTILLISEYLSTLGAAIGKAVEKGMQDGLSTKITHGAEGRVLTDVAAYNPSAEADYLAALQRLQSSAKKLGLTKSQPHVDQLMVPIHHSPDQRVIGASALSLSVDVSSSRVWMIKENIAKHRSALRDVFVPLTEPLSVTALTGTESTLNVIPATVDTTTALSVTLVSASLIPPISTDDYEVAHAEGRDSAGADVNPFSNVDDAKLNIPQ